MLSMQALYEWDGSLGSDYTYPKDWRVQDMAAFILEGAVRRLIAQWWEGAPNGE